MGREQLDRRAVEFAGPQSVRVVEETVEVAPDELVVATERSAISAGTELLVYRGEVPKEMSADTTIDVLDGNLRYPLRYGYAGVGRVVGQGADVPESWRGERVFSFHPHATHMLVPPDAIVPLPDELDAERACMLPSVETALAIVQDARPEIGARVAVFGAGVIGVMTSMLLAMMPLVEVVVIDPAAERRAAAGALDGVAAVHPEAMADAEPRFDLGFELSGNPAALDQCISLMRYDGEVVVGSWYGTKQAQLDLGMRYHRNHISVRSSQVSTVPPQLRGRWTKDRRLEAALEAVGQLPLRSLITHRIPLDEVPDAYARLAQGDHEMLQVLLTYDT
jgi:Threonine dehydrogenase and related Zn-dependent dehydrogenases